MDNGQANEGLRDWEETYDAEANHRDQHSHLEHAQGEVEVVGDVDGGQSSRGGGVRCR